MDDLRCGKAMDCRVVTKYEYFLAVILEKMMFFDLIIQSFSKCWNHVLKY